MARLIYSGIASLDGYVADADGRFAWAEPDEEVHRFINDLERPVGTYLFGRRMYEVMSAWETAHPQADLRREISVGGSNLAAQAIAAGLVDDWHLFVMPVLIGGGTPFFVPTTGGSE
jgi:dihydrofolate reductase